MLWKGKRENRPGKTLVNLDNPELSAFELLLSPSLWDIEHMRGSLLIFREITTGAPPHNVFQAIVLSSPSSCLSWWLSLIT